MSSTQEYGESFLKLVIHLYAVVNLNESKFKKILICSLHMFPPYVSMFLIQILFSLHYKLNFKVMSMLM